MLAAVVGTTLTHVAGIALGVGVVVVIFIRFAWQRSQARKALGERAPISSKLLNPPGHWLSNKVAELDENLSWKLMEALAAGATLGLGIAGLYPAISGIVLGTFTISQIAAHPGSSIFIAFAFLCLGLLGWLIRSISIARRLQEQLRSYRFGLRGEQAVAEALASPALAAAGYVTFHDVAVENAGNIDHVVVGPGGIVVLETKTCAKRKALRDQKESDVHYDGKILTFPWRYDPDAVEQVTRNAEWVRKYLTGLVPADLPIIPVIVVPGWNVISKGNYPVKAMPETYLRDHYLPTLKRSCSPDQLQPIIRLMDNRCRTLEF